MPRSEKPPLRYYHENWWKLDNECIWYLAGSCITDYTPLKVGAWYFSDETQNFQGPYDSREAAEAALAIYCEHL